MFCQTVFAQWLSLKGVGALSIRLILPLFLLLPPAKTMAQATNETLPTGSFIINMGISPQTIANGLKPYGLIYDLTKNYSTPVKWAINQTKAKDGIDFSHNGVDYKGSAFIISQEYRTAAVNARIAYWQSLGVVGATTVGPITVPVFTTLRAAPRWTMDKQNGDIAVDYMINASIPPTAYGGSSSSGWKLPGQLNTCDDIFVMPHADPTWGTHKNLLYWNRDFNGDIWAGCHAVSVLEELFNPANPAEKTTFLSTTGLVNFGDHDDGSPPYTHNFPSDPVMQFLGTVDAAMQNGSEQMFMPLPGGAWRPSTKLCVVDPTQSDVPVNSPGPAVAIVYGQAFGDNNRGAVLYQAGHSNNKGTSGDVAAQRAYFNFCLLSAMLREIVPDITLIPDTLYSGFPVTLTFTLPPGYNIANYTVQWSTSCGGTFSPNSTSQTVIYTPPPSPLPSNCVVSVNIYDVCGREFKNSTSSTLLCQLDATATATNPACNGAATGSISMNISGSPGPYSYNWARGAATGSGTGTNIPNLLAGSYNLTATAANGCAKALTLILTEPTAVAATASGTNILCNGASTGAIGLAVSGGTPGHTYNWGMGITTQNRSNLAAGTYTVTATDSRGCTATASATLTQPAALTATATSANINCFGGNTGGISLAVGGGAGPYSFNWGGGITTQNRSGLTAGTYTVTVTDANGCTKTASATVTQPAAGMTLATAITHIQCAVGTGSINLTPAGGTSPYSFLWTGGATTEDRSGLAAGAYSVTATDASGCTGSTSATVNQTPAVTLSGVATQISCFGGTGSINNTPGGGTAPFSFSWSDGGAATEDRANLPAGTYTTTVTDANGCTATASATINAAPASLLLFATIANPPCNPANGGSTGSIDLSVSGGTPIYTYDWSNDGPEAPDNDPQDLSGLPAGAYVVTVTDANGCTAALNRTLTAPAALNLSLAPTHVTCPGDTDGAIDLSVNGGTAPYTYDWDNDGLEAPDNDPQDLTGLAAGTYTVIVTDANGCTATVSVTLNTLNVLPPLPNGVQH